VRFFSGLPLPSRGRGGIWDSTGGNGSARASTSCPWRSGRRRALETDAAACITRVVGHRPMPRNRQVTDNRVVGSRPSVSVVPVGGPAGMQTIRQIWAGRSNCILSEKIKQRCPDIPWVSGAIAIVANRAAPMHMTTRLGSMLAWGGVVSACLHGGGHRTSRGLCAAA